MAKFNLPIPNPQCLQHSEKLKKHIQQKIAATVTKKITFAEFMHHALYTPELGYYMTPQEKLGAKGDFVTAPEISSLFSRCIARQCAEVLATMQQGVILEFGAGTGIMAADILLYLETIHCLPIRYYILEISPELRSQQEKCLLQKCPYLISRVSWLDALPLKPIKGVILANEILDAMPVHLFELLQGKLFEVFVTNKEKLSIYKIQSQQTSSNIEVETDFCWQLDEPSPAIQSSIENIHWDFLTGIPHYRSEICVELKSWLENLSGVLQQGLVLLIDYGYPASVFYHPQRNQGTLMCHYQHLAHDNPLLYPGIQDITAHVNFSQLAHLASACDFEIVGFVSQANFLLNCGITELIKKNQGIYQQMQYNKEIKYLTLPSEMGETFKVCGLSRKMDKPLMGFKYGDRHHQLYP